MKKKLYKRILKVEILSETPIDDKMTLDDVLNEIETREISSHIKWGESIELTGKRAVSNCEKHGTDVEFFNMDVNGNELDDDF